MPQRTANDAELAVVRNRQKPPVGQRGPDEGAGRWPGRREPRPRVVSLPRQPSPAPAFTRGCRDVTLLQLAGPNPAACPMVGRGLYVPLHVVL